MFLSGKKYLRVCGICDKININNVFQGKDVFMKKLLLFPLIIAMCGGFGGTVMADGYADFDADADAVCTGKICRQIPSGGGMESDKCRQVDYFTDMKSPFVGKCCYAEYWVKGKCTPYGAPANSGECKDYGKTKTVKRACSKSKTNDVVNTVFTVAENVAMGGAQIPDGLDEQALCAVMKESVYTDTVSMTSCTAKKCNSGYLLQTTSNRAEIKIVKEEISGAGNVGNFVASDGICRSKKWLTEFCETSCECKDGEKCVLNEFTVNNHFYNLPEVQAFNRDRACVCVSKSCEARFAGNESAIACCKARRDWDATNNTCKCGEGEEWKKVDGVWKCDKKKAEDEKDPCVYRLTVDIQCPDGTRFYKNQELTKEQVNGLKCAEFKSLMESATNNQMTKIDFLQGIKTDVAAYKKLLETVCGKHRVVKKVVDIAGAKSTLNKFFANAKENASVWKTESGNFNGARLASDLTAGVVLGTVGGVVSANIIKKNQIEKGFDVLHCTIGGQTVADWGDTFNTGLRR